MRVRPWDVRGVPGLRKSNSVSRPRRRSPLRLASLASLATFFALIGAAATVLVAWAFVFIMPDPPAGPVTISSIAGHDLAWPKRVISFWPPPQHFANGASPGLRWARWEGSLPRGRRGLLDHYAIHDLTAGWPIPAVRLRRDLFAQSPQAMAHFTARSGLPPRFGDTSLAIPRTPLWPGFAVDTAFYGVLAFLAWSAPGPIRRHSRRRHGRCLRCGYNLNASAGVCPECGSAAQ